jgi:hypothetical protein
VGSQNTAVGQEIASLKGDRVRGLSIRAIALITRPSEGEPT